MKDAEEISREGAKKDKRIFWDAPLTLERFASRQIEIWPDPFLLRAFVASRENPPSFGERAYLLQICVNLRQSVDKTNPDE